MFVLRWEDDVVELGMFTSARLRTSVQLSLEKTALESQVGIVNAAACIGSHWRKINVTQSSDSAIKTAHRQLLIWTIQVFLLNKIINS